MRKVSLEQAQQKQSTTSTLVPEPKKQQAKAQAPAPAQQAARDASAKPSKAERKEAARKQQAEREAQKALRKQAAAIKATHTLRLSPPANAMLRGHFDAYPITEEERARMASDLVEADAAAAAASAADDAATLDSAIPGEDAAAALPHGRRPVHAPPLQKEAILAEHRRWQAFMQSARAGKIARQRETLPITAQRDHVRTCSRSRLYSLAAKQACTQMKWRRYQLTRFVSLTASILYCLLLYDISSKQDHSTLQLSSYHSGSRVPCHSHEHVLIVRSSLHSFALSNHYATFQAVRCRSCAPSPRTK